MLRSLDLAIRCLDLAILGGSETTDEVAAICARAVRPSQSDPWIPSVAAVCVYPKHLPVAVRRLEGTGVHVASVAGGFPSGGGSLQDRLREIREAVEQGAHEVDIVLNRSLLMEGRDAEVVEELLAAREASGAARLKVILEVGELGSHDRIRKACELAMTAGADFVKTSTGKIGEGASPPAVLCMMEAARDFHAQTGRRVGIKVAGGIRTSQQATGYLTLLQETLGPEWMSPQSFRFGSSSLLEDLVTQLRKERSAR